MSRLPQIRSIRTHGRTVRTPTGQTGPSDRSDRSYPDQNLGFLGEAETGNLRSGALASGEGGAPGQGEGEVPVDAP